MIAMFYAAPKQIYCNIKFMQLRHEKSCLHDGNIARRTPHDNINLDPNISNQPLQHSEKTYSMGPPPPISRHRPKTHYHSGGVRRRPRAPMPSFVRQRPCRARCLPVRGSKLLLCSLVELPVLATARSSSNNRHESYRRPSLHSSQLRHLHAGTLTLARHGRLLVVTDSTTPSLLRCELHHGHLRRNLHHARC